MAKRPTFCSRCGTKQEQHGARYCHQCGAATPLPAAKGSWSAAWGAALLVALAAAMAYSVLGSPHLGATATSWLAASPTVAAPASSTPAEPTPSLPPATAIATATPVAPSKTPTRRPTDMPMPTPSETIRVAPYATMTPTPLPTGPEAVNLASLAVLSASSVLAPQTSLRTGRLLVYYPSNAADGNLATSWVEGTAGSGIGEQLVLTFPRPVHVTRVAIDTGYDLDSETFASNNRVRRVKLLFSAHTMAVDLSDQRGMQDIPIPDVDTTSLILVIEDVFRGKYDDTCIAEVQVWGNELSSLAQAPAKESPAPPASATPAPTSTIVPSPRPICATATDPELVSSSAQARLGCASEAARTVWAAWQPFEGGAMLWLSHTNRVTVFYRDGSHATFPDEWGDRPYTLDSSPPAGRLAPVRGFGWIWKNHPELSQRLGWGVVEEKGFCARIQSHQHGFVLRSVGGSCGDQHNYANEGDWAPVYRVVVDSGAWIGAR